MLQKKHEYVGVVRALFLGLLMLTFGASCSEQSSQEDKSEIEEDRAEVETDGCGESRVGQIEVAL